MLMYPPATQLSAVWVDTPATIAPETAVSEVKISAPVKGAPVHAC
jgi:hypothetical protein